MRAAGLLLAALAAANVAVTVAAETPAAIVVVVKAAHLIDGRGGAPLSPAMVRIEGIASRTSAHGWPSRPALA